MFKNLLKNFKLNESTISMVLGALVVVVIGMLVLNYFRGVKKPQLETSSITKTETAGVSEPQVPGTLPATYKVQKGESLWKIAQILYGSGYNWVDIAKENKLINPSFLAVDQELSIPKVAVRLPKAPVISETQAITGNSYTVVKGDNLWVIAVRAYQDGYQWVKIARENELANPGLIHPGNVLNLPR